MIIIVNGPCGVGKSTVTKLLESKYEKCVHIKADDVHCFIVDSQIIPEHIAITDKNIKMLVKNFLDAGFVNIIIDNVYETKEHIDRIVKELKQYDDKVYTYRLYCELNENIKRDAQRNYDDICGEQRVRELYNIFLNVGDTVGKAIDTTRLSTQEIATQIYNDSKQI